LAQAQFGQSLAGRPSLARYEEKYGVGEKAEEEVSEHGKQTLRTLQVNLLKVVTGHEFDIHGGPYTSRIGSPKGRRYELAGTLWSQNKYLP
jgi:hypothetical protein